MTELTILEPDAAAERAGVRIRPAVMGDLDALHETMGDAGVIAGTLQLPFMSIEARRAWWASLLTDRSTSFLVAELRSTGKAIGNLGLTITPNVRRRHNADLGMSIRDEHQGRGVGTALMAAACDLGDNWLQVRRINLEVHADNVPAIALYTKFGFDIEGTRRGDSFRGGEYIDAHLMARTRPDLR